MAEASVSHEASLVRDLSLFDITMIGVGAMIGAGIFVLTGIAAGEAGPALILSFALNGIITVFTAMVYAELGSAIPEAGGGYLWVKEGLPGPNAFLSGWMSWFAHAVAGSLYGVGFGGFVEELLRVLILGDQASSHTAHLFMSEPLMLPFGLELTEGFLIQKGFAVLVILLFLFINYRGSSETGTAGNIVTVLKVIIISIFIISGLVAIFGDPVPSFAKFDNFAPDGIIGIASAMGLTFIAFEGYEIIVQAGEEVVEPRKNIPRAVFLSLAIVVPIYMLVAFVIIGAVNLPADPGTLPSGEEITAVHEWLGNLGEVGIARAASQFMPFGIFLILIGGLLSTMSALNATTFSSTRVSFAMGRDRSLPDGFAKVSDSTHTPHIALGWTGVLILFMAITLPIEDVAASADIMFLLLFLQVNLAVITIRRKYGDELSYGYLMPFFPIVPIIGIITKLLLAFSLFEVSPIAWTFAIVWIVVGFVLYYVYAKPRQREKEKTPIMQQSELAGDTQQREGYHVLVAIANPASLDSLMPAAIRAARQHDGKITLVTAITVPEPSPLSAGRQYLNSADELKQQALQYAEYHDVHVEFMVRLARRVSNAIIDTARETDADLLIMGWRGSSRNAEHALGTNVDTVIERVNCEVMVLQPGTNQPVKRILVPVALPDQLGFALGSIHWLSGDELDSVDVMHVLSPDTSQSKRDEFESAVRETIAAIEEEYERLRGKINLRIERGTEPVNQIIKASREYDSVLIGATRDSWLQRQFFGSKPQRIASRTETPVIVQRPPAGAIEFSIHQTINYLRGGYAEVDPDSRQRLIDQGFLEEGREKRPEEMETDVPEMPLLIVGILSLIAVIGMYIGQGDTLTWVSVILYFFVLGAFTYLSSKAPTSEQEMPSESTG